MKKRVLVFALSVLMIFSCLPTAFAADEPQITEPPQVTETPQPTETPQISEEPTTQPAETPAPITTPKPTAIPEPSSEPSQEATVEPETEPSSGPTIEPAMQPEEAMLPQSESEAYIVNATSGDYEYSTNTDGSATITKYRGAGGDIRIPDTLNGYKVTRIGNEAFQEWQDYKVESIVLSDNIVSIDTQAFANCQLLKDITLSNKLNSIGQRSFEGCISLKSISIPESVTNIGEDAFFNCKEFETISLSTNISSIGVGAFCHCNNLKEITVNENNFYYKSVDGVLFNKAGTQLLQYPTGNMSSNYQVPIGVTSIGKYSFESCDYIENIILPDGITTILDRAFESCDKLKSITIPNGVTAIYYEAFGLCTNLESITIPGSALSLGKGAFNQCTHLKSVFLTDGLKSIGDGAFSSCHDLGNITIPSSVTSIGRGAFSGCYFLTEITVEESNLNYKSIEGVLFNNTGTQIIQYPPFSERKSYSIPNGVTTIADTAFYDCYRLEYIAIPEGVIDIEEHAFYGCDELERITIPSSVKNMQGYTFYRCGNLKEISVEDSNMYFQSINGVLFDKDGTKLLQYPVGKGEPNYIIPDGITEIGYCSFYHRWSCLKNLYIPDSVTSIYDYTFDDWPDPVDVTIYGETGSYAESFAKTKNMNFVAGELVQVSGVSLNKDSMFLRPGETASLTATVSPDDAVVKDIIWKSSDYNIAYFENGVVTAYHTGTVTITATTWDGSYTDICEVRVEPEHCTVVYCSGGSYIPEETVDFGTSVKEPILPFRDGYCFAGWYPTEACDTAPVSFPFVPTEDTPLYAKWGSPDSYGTSGDYNYWVKNGKATITKYNGSGVEVDIPLELDGYPVDTVGSCAFKDNTIVRKISIPYGITTIGERTFLSCTSLKEINIPDSVSRIGWDTFASCTSLKSIVLPRSLTCIDYALFNYCPSLSDVTIPEGVTRIEGSSFYFNALNSITIPKDVKYIGGSAFTQCSGLSKVYFLGDAPQIGSPNIGRGDTGYDVFDLCGTGLTIYYSKGKTGFTNPWHGYPTAAFDSSAPCTVTFDLNGIGKTIHLYENLYKGLKAEIQDAWCQGQDFVFLGWYLNKECTGTAWDFNNPVNENMTLYAKWIPSDCTVSFDTQGGNPVNPIIIKYGEFLFCCGASRNGYEFLGWYLTPACDTAPITFPYTVKGNTVLYAKWQPIGMKPIPVPSGIPSPYLAGINYSAGSLSRAFSKNIYSYKVTLGENEGSVTLFPAKDFNGAVMTINGKSVPSYTVNLANGKSVKISVKVRYGKASKTYTFTVTRAKSTNNMLASLSASAGAWSQPFDPNVVNYTLSLDENTKSTTMQAAAAAGKIASVSPASAKVTLNNGQSKTVKITVKAQSGARRTYTVTVVRAPSTNANLKSLKGSSALWPAFSQNVTSYNVTLPANKGAFTISAKSAGYKASVYIDGAKKSSKSVALANGQTVTVVVKVVSQAGSEKEYAVTVTRQ